MKRGIQGANLNQSTSPEPFKAFVPNPLPPNPKLQIQGELLRKLEQAHLHLGRLDGLARILPDLNQFIYFYVRKEAVLSSQIEGTQSTLSDLLLFETEQQPGVPLDDVAEVSTYVAALNLGVARIREGYPVSLRMIREVHKALLNTGRGANQEPASFGAPRIGWVVAGPVMPSLFHLRRTS